MSIFDKNLLGYSKFDKAIDNLKFYEPKEGYYLAFSGGKDSCVIKKLCELSGVKFDSHYALTTVDPPELIRFIKEHHSDVEITYPSESMWRLIERKLMPPTRVVRYCCSELKEEGGNGRFVITGVRWAESSRRKNSRERVEFDSYGSNSKKSKELKREFSLLNDNDEKRRMIELCTIKGKNILNPIIDWEDDEVWEFINHFSVPYCELYDQGFSRVGCIGCPLSGSQNMEKEFKKYQKYKINYIKAFERMLKERKRKGKETMWNNGQEVFDWWINESNKDKILIGQISIAEL